MSFETRKLLALTLNEKGVIQLETFLEYPREMEFVFEVLPLTEEGLCRLLQVNPLLLHNNNYNDKILSQTKVLPVRQHHPQINVSTREIFFDIYVKMSPNFPVTQKNSLFHFFLFLLSKFFTLSSRISLVFSLRLYFTTHVTQHMFLLQTKQRSK